VLFRQINQWCTCHQVCYSVWTWRYNLMYTSRQDNTVIQGLSQSNCTFGFNHTHIPWPMAPPPQAASNISCWCLDKPLAHWNWNATWKVTKHVVTCLIRSAKPQLVAGAGLLIGSAQLWNHLLRGAKLSAQLSSNAAWLNRLVAV